MEYKYITNTSFDEVLNKLEETQIVSERVLKLLHKHVTTTVNEITANEQNLTFDELFELFETYNDDFYDAIALYEPIFSKDFRIWLLRRFRQLQNEILCPI